MFEENAAKPYFVQLFDDLVQRDPEYTSKNPIMNKGIFEVVRMNSSNLSLLDFLRSSTNACLPTWTHRKKDI